MALERERYPPCSMSPPQGLEDPIGGAGPSRAEEYEAADAGALLILLFWPS